MKTSRVFELQSQDSKLAHAYLITGVLDGARIVEILKIKGPDLLEIRESPLKINTVRELIHWLALKPHSSPRKLAIIYGAETMTTDAANIAGFLAKVAGILKVLPARTPALPGNSPIG